MSKKFNIHLIDQFLDSVDVLLGNTVDPRVVYLNHILDTVFGPDNGEDPFFTTGGNRGIFDSEIARHRAPSDVEWAQGLLLAAIYEEHPELVPEEDDDDIPVIWDDPELDPLYARLGELMEAGRDIRDMGPDGYDSAEEYRHALESIRMDQEDTDYQISRVLVRRNGIPAPGGPGYVGIDWVDCGCTACPQRAGRECHALTMTEPPSAGGR